MNPDPTADGAALVRRRLTTLHQWAVCGSPMATVHRRALPKRILDDQFLGQPMISTKHIRLQHYDLVCSAQVNDAGTFEPHLVVSKHLWPSRPRMIDVRRGAHATADEAIESAHAQGVQWVMDFG